MNQNIPQYMRFECATYFEKYKRPVGLFRVAYDMMENPDVEQFWKDLLQPELAWFEKNLHIPNTRHIKARDRFWYRVTSSQHIRRMWTLVNIIETYGFLVNILVSSDPGIVCYRDANQVAANPKFRTR